MGMEKEVKYTINTDNKSVESYCEKEIDIDDVMMITWQNLIIMKMNGIEMNEAMGMIYKALFNVYGVEDFGFEEVTNKLNLN